MDIIRKAIEEARNVANIDLHRTSYVPDGQNTRIIKQKALTLRQLEMEAYVEMMRMSVRVNVLREQIAIHDALVSPCRRLPPEILSTIFLLAMPVQWDSEYVGCRRLNLARVCRSWRHVALATPRLWTTLRLAANFNAPRKYVAALKDDLAKTAQAPLQLLLEMYDDKHPRRLKDPWSDEAWALLCAQSHRWERTLFVGIPSGAYEDLIERDLPALRDLSISLYEEAGATIHVPIQAFRHAPKVTSLSIRHNWPIAPFDLPSSWSLTELSIHCDENDCTLVPSIGVILSCSETLRVCHLSADGLCPVDHLSADGHCSVEYPPMSFPHLEELSLCDSAIELCLSFVVPNLRCLWMGGFPRLRPFVPLQVMLRRSGSCPSLRCLTFEGLEPEPSAQDIIACLHRTPSLEELNLRNNPVLSEIEISLILPDLLRAMIRDPDTHSSMAVLPNLLKLAIDFGARYEDARNPVYGTLLKSVLASRRQEASVDGKELALLQSFVTDGGGKNCCWPPRLEHPLHTNRAS